MLSCLVVYFLLEREKRELLTARKRQVSDLNGNTHIISMYDVCWRWLERIVDLDSDFSVEEIVSSASDAATSNETEIEDELPRVISNLVEILESYGGCITTDVIGEWQIGEACRRIEKFKQRKKR